MKPLTLSERKILETLVSLYYSVVPVDLQSYCSTTALITRAVLNDFGIKAAVVPCQAWCATPDHNYVVGFMGNRRVSGKWDGHAICLAGDCFIDASLQHFKREFGLEVPQIALVKIFGPHTQVIGRLDLGPQGTLWWHPPPAGVSTRVPKEPPDLVAAVSAQLIAKMRSVSG